MQQLRVCSQLAYCTALLSGDLVHVCSFQLTVHVSKVVVPDNIVPFSGTSPRGQMELYAECNW